MLPIDMMVLNRSTFGLLDVWEMEGYILFLEGEGK